MSFRDLLLALGVVTIWGLNFSVIKFGLQELPPLLFSALRFAVAAIPAVFFIPRPKTSWWNILGVGLFLGVLKFGLVFMAMESDISAGLASLLLQAQVFFTILLSMVLLGETIGRHQTAGILVALAGFAVFVFTATGGVTPLGLGMILLAGLFWAFANLITKRVKGVNALHFLIWVCLVPPLPLLGLSLWLETPDPLTLLANASLDAWLSLAFVSYVSTLMAFAWWGGLLLRYPAATVTPFALLVPVVGIASSAWLLGEQLQRHELFGAIAIMTGLVLCVFGRKLPGLRPAVQLP
ncbi:EamA family transporter [Bowmanella dokdonensis]|uniref:EamA family transporter n=1 Tax=Bowmanella dokdonensis TaxID=751969 RepID=A0A939IQP1_9ALTE|nr:EamA family transporter [Bowmanella dokdonensis]MBN7827145.1 EamA family transporter [Bowmanella dokdonensis]